MDRTGIYFSLLFPKTLHDLRGGDIYAVRFFIYSILVPLPGTVPYIGTVPYSVSVPVPGTGTLHRYRRCGPVPYSAVFTRKILMKIFFSMLIPCF